MSEVEGERDGEFERQLERETERELKYCYSLPLQNCAYCIDIKSYVDQAGRYIPNELLGTICCHWYCTSGVA